MSSRDVGVVIPAAGAGLRAGGGEPKQFRHIGGVPLLLRTIRPFARHPQVSEIVVALPERHAVDPPAWIRPVLGKRLSVTAGGMTRAESVALGLAALSSNCEFVLVHDAARPFVSRELIDRVIEALTPTAGAIAAIPAADTLKLIDPESMTVLSTVDRKDLWRAQTPQGFPRDALERAMGTHMDRISGTDEAGFAEAAGIEVRIVPGSSCNLKITTAEDFLIAEAVSQGWSEQ